MSRHAGSRTSTLASTVTVAARYATATAATIIALSLSPPPSHAVILAGGDGTGNVEAPTDDPGFANVVSTGLSAVYLGNGWVISAAHVETSSVRIGTAFYRGIEGSRHRLTNPGSFFRPDLAVWKLYPSPELPALQIRATPPVPGEEVVLIGNSLDRGEPTSWEGIRGFAWRKSRSIRWGTNVVALAGNDVRVKKTDLTRSFTTDFSESGGTEHEAHVAMGDSGGAAFIKRDGVWELAGVLYASGSRPGQPAGLTLFGNIAHIGDLSHYRDEILALTSQPACSDGLDDDGDGLIDHPEDPGCGDALDRTETSDATKP
jgi:hypothetical protein